MKETHLAIACLALSLGALGWHLATRDGSSRSSSSSSDGADDGEGAGDRAERRRRSRQERRDKGSGSDRSDRKRQLRGWVPKSAREVRTRDSLPEQSKPTAHCGPTNELVTIAKDIATGVDRELRDATKISDQEEAELSKRLERKMPEALKGKWDLPADVARYGPYLQALVDHLAKHSTRRGLNYRVHLVRDDAFNAFALPGGLLAVHTGALTSLRTEAELVAVLGHEIAHVELRHCIASYQYAKAILGAAADEVAVILQTMSLPLSSGREFEADVRGIELSELSQYDPGAAGDLWQRMAADHPRPTKNPRGVIEAVLGMADSLLRTHPPAQDRCHRARKIAARFRKDGSYRRYYQGQTNLRERRPGPDQAY